MRRGRSSFAILLTTLLGASIAGRAQSPPAVEGAAFLLLPMGARATALGQAAVADGGTSEALFWNPAGLATLTRTELAVHHYTAFFGDGSALVAVVPVTNLGTFSAGVYVVDYGDLDVTTGGNVPIGRITPRNIALYAGYATDLVAGVTAGITYKLVQFRVDCSGSCANIPTAVGTTHAVDVGVQWQRAGRMPVTVAAAVRHLGFKLQVNNQAQADPLPTRLVVGVRWDLVPVSVGAERFDLRVLADVEGVVGEGSMEPVPLIGVESGVGNLLRLRAGYAFVDATSRGPSLGLGLTFGQASFDIGKTFYAADAIGDKEPVHLSFRLAL
jgi:hypothetical protein